jgi:3-methyladenine DNA glycosylase AlkD
VADDQVPTILAWLERRGTRRNREGMARFGIVSAKAFGVSMTTMRPLIKRLGRDHSLAQRLWATGWHEARILASFVDEPSRVTPAQMERWCSDFDNWAVCDSVCMHLFDRTPHAFAMAQRWSRRRGEFVRRAGFALLASLAIHDKKTADPVFLRALKWIERGATDQRNFVKKAVNWALRQIGKRNLALNAEAIALADRLAGSSEAAARWVGKDALRELTSVPVARRLGKKGIAARR